MAREKQGERLIHLRCLAAMAKHAAVFIILAGCQRGQCYCKKQQEKRREYFIGAVRDDAKISRSVQNERVEDRGTKQDPRKVKSLAGKKRD